MVEGIEQYPKTEKGYTFETPDVWGASGDASPWYGAWWGGNLRGVKDYPINFGSDDLNDQLVYSPHDYGPSVYNQTWFDKDFTTQTLLDDYWYDTWAYIDDQHIAPLLIGEWGGHMDGGKNQHWMELLRDYMVENHINHTFWCINPNSGDTGGLIGNDWATWDNDKYALFEESLWQTDGGKYISLDHSKALGTKGNSISISEYYGSTTTPIVTKPVTTAPTVVTTTEKPKETTAVTTKPPVTTTTAPVTTTKATVTTKAPDITTVTKPVTTLPSSNPDKVIIYGDIDNNGNVDLSDLIKLSQHLLGDITLTGNALKAADVSGDGVVDILDLPVLRQFIMNDPITLGPKAK